MRDFDDFFARFLVAVFVFFLATVAGLGVLLNVPVFLVDPGSFVEHVIRFPAGLGKAEFNAGRGMSRGDAIGLALGESAQIPAAATDDAAAGVLGRREAEVAELVAQGLSNAEIAGQLVISPLTAKTHVSNVLRKLDCRDRAALVALAYESGLITPGGAL